MLTPLLIPLIISIYSSFSSPDTRLIGQWKGTDIATQEMGEMEFDQDGYFSFVRFGVKRGGKEFKEGDRLINTLYFTDTETIPFKIDIVIREKGSDKDESRLLGIYEFVNKDQLKISFNLEASDRPKDFLSAKDIIILDRKTDDKDTPLSTSADFNRRSVERFKVNDFQGALDDLNKAIEMNPSGHLYFNRAYVKSTMDDCKGAIKDYTKTIEFEYRVEKAYFERGLCKDRTHDPDGAFADYTNAIKINKEYSEAYSFRGILYHERKKYQEAMNDFDKAIKINVNDANAYANRAFVKKDLGDLRGACNDWRKAVEAGYGDAESYLNLFCK